MPPAEQCRVPAHVTYMQITSIVIASKNYVEETFKLRETRHQEAIRHVQHRHRSISFSIVTPQLTKLKTVPTLPTPGVNPSAVVDRPQTASTSRVLTVPDTPQDFGIHVYTQAQIESSKGMLKTYRLFWNDKAYELCSDVVVREKLKDKSAIQGAINVSWTMQKSSHLQVQADEVREESKTIYLDPVKRAHLLTPIERNLKRVLETHAYVQQLCDHSDLPVDKLENTIDCELQELKKAQDALNKALEGRRQDMDQVKQKTAEMHTVKSPVKLCDAEIEDIAQLVKMESENEDNDALSDHDKDSCTP